MERKIPETIQEAYDLRDASGSPEERDFYQEHVYRLRAKHYRSRNIRTGESVRRREGSRAETLRAQAQGLPAGENEGVLRPWWKRMFGLK
jgi:hypothetical protein